jgi:hypothetical protein
MAQKLMQFDGNRQSKRRALRNRVEYALHAGASLCPRRALTSAEVENLVSAIRCNVNSQFGLVKLSAYELNGRLEEGESAPTLIALSSATRRDSITASLLRAVSVVAVP